MSKQQNAPGGLGNDIERAPSGVLSSDLVPLSLNSASEVAFQAIRRAIVNGHLCPGDRLREVALAKQLGISATPVREALARLQQEGLIQFEPRRGAVVPQLEPQDVIEVYELRELLEAFAARRAAMHRDSPDQRLLIERLEAIAAAAAPLAERREAAAYNRLDVEFHETLMQLAGNARALRVFRGVHAQVQAVRLRAITLPGRPARSQAEHEQLVDAIRAGDATAAERVIRHHISSVKDEVLAQLGAL